MLRQSIMGQERKRNLSKMPFNSFSFGHLLLGMEFGCQRNSVGKKTGQLSTGCTIWFRDVDLSLLPFSALGPHKVQTCACPMNANTLKQPRLLVFLQPIQALLLQTTPAQLIKHRQVELVPSYIKPSPLLTGNGKCFSRPATNVLIYHGDLCTRRTSAIVSHCLQD